MGRGFHCLRSFSVLFFVVCCCCVSMAFESGNKGCTGWRSDSCLPKAFVLANQWLCLPSWTLKRRRLCALKPCKSHLPGCVPVRHCTFSPTCTYILMYAHTHMHMHTQLTRSTCSKRLHRDNGNTRTHRYTALTTHNLPVHVRRYNTESVSHDVLAAMKQKMVEGNSSSSHSFLLDDDSTLPFAAAEVLGAMIDTDLYTGAHVRTCSFKSRRSLFVM